MRLMLYMKDKKEASYAQACGFTDIRLERYNESVDIIYTLAFLLNLNGDKASAIKLLENVKIKDVVLVELLNEVKG